MTEGPPLSTASRADRMHAVLDAALEPQQLIITDQSHLHAGHAGAREAGETHYSVTIVAEKFRNNSRVECSRLVHKILAAEFERGLHALSLHLRAPN